MEWIPLPRFVRDLSQIYRDHSVQILVAAAVLLVVYFAWYTHWRTRYRRLMRASFAQCGLYGEVRKPGGTARLYPLFDSYDNSDEEFLVMKYHMRPGMAVQQFEDKKKQFEAAFNRKVVIYGRGKYIFFKIRKIPYDEPGIYNE